MILKNKKAIGYTEIVFILLNLIVFSFLLLFITLTSNNALVYEQTYSKQIALALNETFKIDSEKKEVFTSLNKKGGYSFKYFSDYNLSLQLDGKNLNLIIK